jgi:acetyltransferase-like isoleucine patch superfamily enzyme
MKMNTNSFLSTIELNQLGFPNVGDKNVFISRYAKFYGAEYLSLANNIRIDDFCVISVGQPSTIGNWVHIGTSASIHCPIGIDIEDFAGISPGSRIFGISNNFSDAFPMHPYLNSDLLSTSKSKITLGRFSQVGANSVVLPNSLLAEGAVLGANSMLKAKTELWTIYAGNPAIKIGKRKLISNLSEITD